MADTAGILQERVESMISYLPAGIKYSREKIEKTRAEYAAQDTDLRGRLETESGIETFSQRIPDWIMSKTWLVIANLSRPVLLISGHISLDSYLTAEMAELQEQVQGYEALREMVVAKKESYEALLKRESPWEDIDDVSAGKVSQAEDGIKEYIDVLKDRAVAYLQLIRVNTNILRAVQRSYERFYPKQL